MARVGVTNPDGRTPSKKKADPKLSELQALIKRLGQNGNGNFGSASALGLGQKNTSGSFAGGALGLGRTGGKSNNIPLGGFPFQTRSSNKNIGPGIVAPNKSVQGAVQNPRDLFKGLKGPTAFGPANAMMGAAGLLLNPPVQASGGVGGGFGGGTGYQPQAMPSLEEILAQVAGSGQVDTPDAAAMASAQFDPQFDMLAELRSATTGRMNQQSQDAQSMYNDLASSIEADKGGVTQSYDAAAQAMDAAFSGAANRVQATGDQSNADMNAMMSRLGIGAAAPDTASAIDASTARSANSIAEMQANYAGNNEANRQSMTDYMTSQANTAGLAGANASADVQAALSEALSGFDAKKLGLTGERAATENEYAMAIAGMQQDASSQAQEMAMRIYEQQLAQQQQSLENSRWDQQFQWDQQMDESGLEIQRAAEERALQEMLRKAQEGGPSAPQTKDASTLMMQEALNIFGGDDQMANVASNAVMETIANTPDIKNLQDLLSAVGRRFPPTNPNRRQYMHLASLYGQAAGL